MPDDSSPLALSLTPSDSFTQSIFDGVGRGEFQAELLGAPWKDEEGGWYGMVLKLVPTQAPRLSTEEAIAKVAGSIASALPPHGPSPGTPEQKALADLLADPATHDVAEHLIEPLLAREPPLKIVGSIHQALARTALAFKDYQPRKLKFAAARLLKGKHEFWPDDDEVFSALGRYDAHVHPRDKPEGKLTGEEGPASQGNGRAVA